MCAHDLNLVIRPTYVSLCVYTYWPSLFDLSVLLYFPPQWDKYIIEAYPIPNLNIQSKSFAFVFTLF